MTVKTNGDIGERLFLWRDAAGWSQVEMAERARISRGTIVLTESGKTSPSLPTLRRIARALGVTVEEFLSDDPEDHLKGRASELVARLKRLTADDRRMLLHGLWPEWTTDAAADARAMELALAFERETGAKPEDVRRALIELDTLTARRLIAEGTVQAEAEAAYRRLLFEAVERGELSAAEAAEKSNAFNAAA